MNLKLLILALFLKYQLIFEINSFLLEYKKSYVKNRYVLVFENIYIVLILNLALGRRYSYENMVNYNFNFEEYYEISVVEKNDFKSKTKSGQEEIVKAGADSLALWSRHTLV